MSFIIKKHTYGQYILEYLFVYMCLYVYCIILYMHYIYYISIYYEK